MRTTLDLPENLLSEAMAITHSETKTKTIILALEELIRKTKLQELKSFKGQLNLEMDINSLRNRKQ